MSLYSLSLVLHLVAGSVALLLFWCAAAMRKGTPLHRRIGQIYLIAMVGVIVSGASLAHALLERGSPVAAMFLCFLLLLVSSACWSAWRAIRDRADRRAYFGPMYWFFTAAVALSGMAMIALGLQIGATLFVVFGSVGVLAGAGSLHAWRRSPSDPKWWLKEHYGAMIGNGVATHIAFIGIGLRNALPGIDPQLLQSIAWFGPLVAAGIAAWWLNRRYGRSSSAPRSRATAGMRTAGAG
jgi:uncharacterized membrane protein